MSKEGVFTIKRPKGARCLCLDYRYNPITGVMGFDNLLGFNYNTVSNIGLNGKLL